MRGSTQVTVNGLASALTRVATALPSVTVSQANLPFMSDTMTIDGVGFDPVFEHNTVTLSSGTATVVSATPTQLVLRLKPPLKFGPLIATVTTNGAVTTAQVAKVVPRLAMLLTDLYTTTSSTKPTISHKPTNSQAVTDVHTVVPTSLPIGSTAMTTGMAISGTTTPISYGGSGLIRVSSVMTDARGDEARINESASKEFETAAGDSSVSDTGSTPVITHVKATATTSDRRVVIVWTVSNDDGVNVTTLKIDDTQISPSSINSTVSGATTTYTYTGVHVAGSHTYTIDAAGLTGMTAETVRGSFTVTDAAPASPDAGATGGDSNTALTRNASDTDSIESSSLTNDDTPTNGWIAKMAIAGSGVIGAIAWWPRRTRRRTQNMQR